MEYVTLGKTGLQVSVISLGGGGASRLGLHHQAAEQESAKLVLTAIEKGINLIDTAEAYGTESRIGLAIRQTNRERLYLSSKYSLHRDGELKKPKELEKSLDRSLKNLQTEYLDIYHLHGVSPQDYAYAVQYLVPEMEKMKEKGKIRHLGITEAFVSDPSHQMLEMAIQDDCWEVMMIGFNLLNQSAREKLFPTTMKKNIGVLAMFAVRRALSNPEALRDVIQSLIDQDLLNKQKVNTSDPLGFLIHPEGGLSLTDAAYRFCRYEPGIHTVLSGTGNIDHLQENIKSAQRNSLPAEDVNKVKELFALVETVSGN